MNELDVHSRYTDHAVYIDSNDQLQHFCMQWRRASVIALDTEFIRTDTFYPLGALIQLSDGHGIFLIDPLTIDDFTPLKALLEDTAIPKVLHSCSEDLEVFDRLLGALPQPIFDTQIAAALDGCGFSLSYQRLTEALLNIHVPKGETRSDWLQRPLTQSQLHYAALDVAYLPAMYQQLRDSLQGKHRLPWLEEECGELLTSYRANSDAEQYFKRVKSTWKLSAREMGILQAIVLWREQTARNLDRPRGRILKDRCCFDIARRQPHNNRELGAIDEVGPNTVHRFGEAILDIIDRCQRDAVEGEVQPPPLPTETRAVSKALKSHVHHRAAQLQMAEEMLARNRDYESLIRSGLDGGAYCLPPSLSGWRKAVVGDELINIARSFG